MGAFIEAIIVSGGDQPARRVECPRRALAIGIGGRRRNDVHLLGSTVAGRHAQITFERGRYVVRDLGSTSGTRVNGHRIEDATTLGEDDRIGIGEFELELEFEAVPIGDSPDVDAEPWEPANAVEAGLVAAVASGDLSSRLVYADWLESRGDSARAEYLRLQQQLVAMSFDDPWFLKRASRLRALAVDARWRRRVAQAPIENCGVAFELVCPRRWDSLATTDRPDVRSCDTCRQSVYYCTTVEDARERARRGQCVAVDMSNRRSPYDLEEGAMVIGQVAWAPDVTRARETPLRATTRHASRRPSRR